MKRSQIALLFVACAVALGLAASPSAGEKPIDPSSIEFRSKFIESFNHIPYDSTADDAMLLRILIDSMNAKRGVEVGVARGFGAMNMGIALERTGGHLYGVDIDARMCAKARENLKTVALDKFVTVIEGDALKVLPKLEGKYDFVFLDALKRDYFRYFKDLEGKLVDGALIAADNSIRSARAMKDFLDFVFKSDEYDAITIRASMAKNDGMTLIYKIPAGKLSPGPVKIAARRKQLKALAADKKADKTVIDSMLLRVLAESAGAKSGLAFCADNGAAAVNIGIAMERSGGKLTVVASCGDAVRAAIKASGLDKTVSVVGDKPHGLSGSFDLLFLDGDPSGHLPRLRNFEDSLQAGAVIIADNALAGGKAKGFADYLAASPLYDAVIVRNEDKKIADGMTVAHKIWTPLFNGRDLDGWVVKCKPGDKGKGFWTVKDGAIVCDSMTKGKHNYVWLMTKGQYADFELRLKVRGHADKSPRGNSGVQIRSRYDDKIGWLDGPQVDIHPPAPWRTGLIYDETREAKRWIHPSLKSWSIKREQGPKECRWIPGGWNNLVIRCKGTKIITRLNGLTVTDFDGKGVLDDDDHKRHNVGMNGPIALQLHSGDKLLIEFKDIYIRTLE